MQAVNQRNTQIAIQPIVNHPDLIEKVALRILGELSISIFLVVLCIPFTPISAIPLLFNGMALQILASLVVRIMVARAEARGADMKQDLAAKWIPPTIFAQGTKNIHTLIHESGHALAAKALLKKSSPRIAIYPYTGGATFFNLSEPTSLGHRIGVSNIQPLVALSGPLLSLSVSSIMLGTGLSLQNSSPEEGRMLIISSIINSLLHALYALTAFITHPANLSHDFVALAAAGVHPAISVIFILAVPALTLAAHHFLTRQ